MLTMSKHKGFVVISVLLITTISTIIAISAVGESRLQERISGNQVKELNARAKAEEGIFAGSEYAKTQLTNGMTVLAIRAELNGKTEGDDELTGIYSLSVEDPSSISNKLVLMSEGNYQGSSAYLKAEILLSDPVQGTTVPGGVVACKNISLTEGSVIDSYNSFDGDYDQNNANSSANVVAIEGNIDLAGHSVIKGDLTVNGTLTQEGSAAFTGDISVIQNITLNNAIITGSVSSGAEVYLAGGNIGGDLSAVGSIKLPYINNSLVDGSVTYNDDIILQYNGEWIKSGDYTDFGWTDYFYPLHKSGAVVPDLPKNACDELDVANAFPSVTSDDIYTGMTDSNSNGATTTLIFTPEVADVFATDGTLFELDPKAKTSELWEGEKFIYILDNMDLNNTTVIIDGDVTIMLTGNLTTAGNPTGFTFKTVSEVNEYGNTVQVLDTNSSLTLLVEGKVITNSDAKLFPGSTIDIDDKKVPLTLISSFESSVENGTENENAIYMLGDTAMYAQVYAPLGNVEYAASGALMGSLQGKNVNVSGSGDIHYDEALEDLGISDPGGSSADARFTSIHYYYPD